MNPMENLSYYRRKNFEQSLYEYLQLLILLAVVAGALSLIVQLAKAVYLDVFLTVNIQYLRMMNYALGRATSVIFFYLFAGIFFQFIVSLIALAFTRKQKMVHIMQVQFLASTPLLLFGWLFILAPSLLLWSLFLLVMLLRARPFSMHINKTSIDQRD